jgi:hypothetical protein
VDKGAVRGCGRRSGLARRARHTSAQGREGQRRKGWPTARGSLPHRLKAPPPGCTAWPAGRRNQGGATRAPQGAWPCAPCRHSHSGGVKVVLHRAPISAAVVDRADGGALQALRGGAGREGHSGLVLVLVLALCEAWERRCR